MASIKQTSERKYKLTVSNGYRPDGRKICRSKTVTVPPDTPKNAVLQYVMAQAEQFEREVKQGFPEDRNTTFEEYAARWLERQRRYSPNTLEGYRRQLETMYPYIGALPVCRIRPMALEEMLDKLRKRCFRGWQIGECTVQKYLMAVSAVLQDAKRNQLIEYNPARMVSLPVLEKREQRIPDEREMRRLVSVIDKQKPVFRAFYMLAILTGCRRGELCALRWSDANWDRITVSHSKKYVPRKGILDGSTKSGKTRTLGVDAAIRSILLDLLKMQVDADLFTPDGYIFLNTMGNPYTPDAFTKRMRRMLDENGFPKDYHLHTLRHFLASYLLSNSISKQTTADILGHADTSFLERTYCHPLPEYKREAASCIAGFICAAKAV